MKYSIVICTWNRSALLNETLNALSRLEEVDYDSFEVLVVNNCCTDLTNDVLDYHQRLRRIPLRITYEPQQGLSSARNRGASEAKGDWIVWTDDDVIVSPRWLKSYDEAIQRNHSVAYLGGPVEPWFSVLPPKWLQRNWEFVKRMYAITPSRIEDRLIQDNEAPFGANMVVRVECQRMFQFPTDRGRNPHNLLGGEETALFAFLRRCGYPGLWVSAASVKHYLPENRLTLDYISRFSFAEGRIFARDINLSCYPAWNGAPRWVWRGYLASWVSRESWRLLRNRYWMSAFVRHAFFCGMIEECRNKVHDGVARESEPNGS